MPEIGAAQCRGGRLRGGSDHRSELHPEHEKFRHRHQLVEWPSVDAQRMHVAADQIGQNPAFQLRFGGAEAERAYDTPSPVVSYRLKNLSSPRAIRF